MTAAERLRALADLERREKRDGWEALAAACDLGAAALERSAGCCSKTCGAQERDARTPANIAARMRGLEALRNQRRPSKVSAKLAGCKTLGEAYRLGFRDGYGLGWHRRNRGRRTPVHDVHDASRRTA